MPIPANTPSAALQTRPGTSRIELSAEVMSGHIRREPISVWALLKDALNSRNNAVAVPDESFVVTRPAPLLLLPEPRDEVQMDRRAAPPPEDLALTAKQTALTTIAREQPKIHAMITALWGRQECSDYIQGLVMNGDDGASPRPPRLKIDTLTALLDLDRLHDIHLGELRDAAGIGRRPNGSH
jgi:hypothetical protein